MMTIDVKTVLLTSLFAGIAAVAIMISLWRQNRHRFQGLALMVLQFSLLTVGTALVIAQNVLPAFVSIVLSNTLLAIGMVAGYMGMEGFVGKKSRQTHNYLFVVAYAAAQWHFTFIRPDMAWRVFCYSLISMVVFSQGAWLLLFRVSAESRRFTGFLGLLYGAGFTVNGLRMAESLTEIHSDRLIFYGGNFQALFLLAYQMLILGMIFGITWMINSRLNTAVVLEEKKFSRAFNVAPYLVSLSRKADGVIVDVNRMFTELTGYSREEAIGRSTLALKLWERKEDRDAMIADMEKQGVQGAVLRLRTKNGDFFIAETYMEEFSVEDEPLVLTSIKDVTRRELAESQLRELNEHLKERIAEETARRVAHERIVAQSARLADMGKMIGAIAHQWRQPLATLGMIVQRVYARGKMGELTADQWDEFKGSSMKQIKHMSDTIEEFKNFYRQEKQKEPFYPLDGIKDAVKLISVQLKNHGIQVDVVCPDEANREIIGYPNEFKQVILNLLGNAHDAILESRHLPGPIKEGVITFAVSKPSENALFIDVRDNGVGIPPEAVPMIFDPSFTTKEKSGGSGIGLYMSRMIIQESMKGRLTLLDDVQETVFRIEMPLEGES